MKLYFCNKCKEKKPLKGGIYRRFLGLKSFFCKDCVEEK